MGRKRKTRWRRLSIEEYTKITTPRQDVLFKKGYLSQKKPQSSVESASTTTTPTASTNGTPDTQSTNGINSDYSEGYENGETDCVIPYDDASYYYPPPEAVFTDPTGQVYYGQTSRKMATIRNSVFFVLSAMIALAYTYPTTVPPSPEVCSKMTPGHGPSPQKSESPYTLQVSSTQVKGGSIVQVTLDGHGKSFKGFYVQARDASGTRTGTFIPDDGIVKVHGCGGIKNTGAHHSGKDDKSNVVIHWKAPQKYDGTVTFISVELGGGHGHVRPLPLSRYTYMRGQSPLNYPPQSVLESPVKGGFHYLDDVSNSKYGNPSSSQFGIIPTSSRKVKFYDDSSMPSRQHFPANYYHSPTPSYLPKPEYHYYDSGYPSPQDKPTSGWSQPSPQPVAKQYGTIGNDYGVIDTAIVLPKGMQSFDIPRYGYLVYNPKKGPPFYIIPTETEAFEAAHFGFGRSKRN